MGEYRLSQPSMRRWKVRFRPAIVGHIKRTPPMPNKREAIERVISQQARDLLAAEFDAADRPNTARDIRDGHADEAADYCFALQAIEAALSAFDMGVSEEMIEAGRAVGLPEMTKSDYERIFLAMQATRLSKGS